VCPTHPRRAHNCASLSSALPYSWPPFKKGDAPVALLAFPAVFLIHDVRFLSFRRRSLTGKHPSICFLNGPRPSSYPVSGRVLLSTPKVGREVNFHGRAEMLARHRFRCGPTPVTANFGCGSSRFFVQYSPPLCRLQGVPILRTIAAQYTAHGITRCSEVLPACPEVPHASGDRRNISTRTKASTTNCRVAIIEIRPMVEGCTLPCRPG
jgi:hypothetical protein